MRYFGWFFGIQLLAAAVWHLYFNVYLIGFVLLGLSSFFLLPPVFKLLTRKFKSNAIAGIAVFGIVLCFILPVGIERLLFIVKMPEMKHMDSFLAFQRNLDQVTKPCLDSYGTCFSKTPKTRDDQCNLILTAQSSCLMAENAVSNVSIPADLPGDIKVLLEGIKTDTRYSLINWKNVYSEYSKMCNSSGKSADETTIKIELLSAFKNKYFTDLKTKKVKTLLGF